MRKGHNAIENIQNSDGSDGEQQAAFMDFLKQHYTSEGLSEEVI